MKRPRKGTTRTGAIPFCMAEVSPRQSREARFDRAMSTLMHEGELRRERLLFADPVYLRHDDAPGDGAFSATAFSLGAAWGLA